MRLHGLRILVALSAFAAGVAAASLWNFLRAPLVCPAYRAVADAPPTELPPEPPPAKADPLERCKLGQFSLDAHELFTGGQNSQGTGMVLNLWQNKAVSKPLPRYPVEAKDAQVEGVVTVQLVIDEKGYVTTARAVSGHDFLRAASVEAACRARFSPTKVSGRPVKVAGVMTYRFVLHNR